MTASKRVAGHAARPHRLPSTLLSFLALLALATLTHAQVLQDQFVSLKNRTDLGSASIGAIAVDIQNGEVLFSVNADRPLIPASNMKLLTSGAALLTLGPDFSFETTLVDAGNRLILRGSGDPALGDPEILSQGGDIGVEDLLNQMVQAVKRRGIDHVDEIVVDDRVFDREYAHPSWPVDQLNTWYCAEVGGVNFHLNVLSVYPKPANDGWGVPTYSLEPAAPWIDMENHARTVTDGRQTVWIARPRPENSFQLRGDVRYPGSEPIRVAIHEPPLMAGKLIADRLARAGVQVGVPGGPRGIDAVRLAKSDEVFPDGQPLLIVRTRMQDILRRCNTDSYNLYAEALIKTLGHEVNQEPGSWESGAAVIRMLLTERLGPDHATRTHIADGSGMSRDDHVAADTLASWLTHLIQDKDIGDAMLASLATPGQGTLHARFQDADLANAVHAKSGYLNGVRSLSGFIVAPNGHKVVFSMLINDIPPGRPNQNAKTFLEHVVEFTDEWLADRVAHEASALGG